MLHGDFVYEVRIDGYGIAIGEARGARYKALKAARNALALGLSAQQTAQISSLSVEEVQELAKDLCKTPPAI